MKYGILEEKDLAESHRKILKDGREWGQKWLTGFFQSLNKDPTRKEKGLHCELFQTCSCEDNLADFVFAVGNRICAVLFDVYFVEGMGFDNVHFLTFERRMRLIEASMEHGFYPMIVNVRWKFDAKQGRNTFETTENWMTDIVSGESAFPEGGLTDEKRPMLNWEAHIRAVIAAADELKNRGYDIHWMAYDLGRKPDLWVKDLVGRVAWVLVSYHTLAAEGKPDYSYFDYKDTNFVDKNGIGIDVALYNEDDEREDQVFRGPDVKAEIIAVKELYSPTSKKEKTVMLIEKMEAKQADMPDCPEKRVLEKKIKFFKLMCEKTN